MERLAVITDFDGTLMEQDVGNKVMEALGIYNLPEVIKASQRAREQQIGSTELIKLVYPLLEGKQIMVDQVLEKVHLRDGAEHFLHFCKTHQMPVTILSDGMQYYIERLLEKLNVEADEVISNPITYTEDGKFRFGLQNDNPSCDWCGCCKAGVVRNQKSQGKHIIYIGDGISDYYGSGFADWIFARGSLARYLEQEGTPYYPFRTFHDILRVLETNLDAFRNGSAGKRTNRPSKRCRF
jgi:2-hydroxy-3-keto-5-methylthiopentenyl-1-phosphate phosphatase